MSNNDNHFLGNVKYDEVDSGDTILYHEGEEYMVFNYTKCRKCGKRVRLGWNYQMYYDKSSRFALFEHKNCNPVDVIGNTLMSDLAKEDGYHKRVYHNLNDKMAFLYPEHP
jgi:hypothetical protein